MESRRVSEAVIVALILTIPGCGRDDSITGKIGRDCTIQFRRGDALGTAASLPVSPTTTSLNGAEVTLSGCLTAVREGWFTIVANKIEYCVPEESILLIEFRK